MSHFIVNMILPKNEVSEEKISELLSPYDENKSMEPYIAYYKKDARKVHREELKRLKEIIDKQEKGYKIEGIKELYEKIKKMTYAEYYDYCFEGRDRDERDNILSTYNRSSKWDWYQIGGRFAGRLLNRNSEKAGYGLKSNSCTTEHALSHKKIPFALILPNGQWIESGNMGWWAIVEDEMPVKKWEKIVLNSYKKYPKHIVIQIDCHI